MCLNTKIDHHGDYSDDDDDDNKHLWSAYIPRTVLSVLHVLPILIILE